MHEELESTVARFLGKEDAVVYGMGRQWGQGGTQHGHAVGLGCCMALAWARRGVKGASIVFSTVMQGRN